MDRFHRNQKLSTLRSLRIVLPEFHERPGLWRGRRDGHQCMATNGLGQGILFCSPPVQNTLFCAGQAQWTSSRPLWEDFGAGQRCRPLVEIYSERDRVVCGKFMGWTAGLPVRLHRIPEVSQVQKHKLQKDIAQHIKQARAVGKSKWADPANPTI